jgi:hypothetical protein
VKTKELSDTAHLSFHLHFVDLLAMLAKGDDVEVLLEGRPPPPILS